MSNEAPDAREGATEHDTSENGLSGEPGEFKLIGKIVEFEPVGVVRPLAPLQESLLDLRLLFLPRDEKGLDKGDWESKLVPRGRNPGGALGGVSIVIFRFCRNNA